MSDKEANSQSETGFAPRERIDYSKLELAEEVIQLNRVAKVVKGGRRFSFSALVVVGDKNGHVGLGFGKANEVPESIQKGVQDAKKNLIRVPRAGRTIPYAIHGEYAAAKVMLRPASEGTGIIAGPAIRSIMELGGLQDILTKNLGSSNVINILKAVIEGLKSIRDPDEVMRLRGKNLEDVVGKRRAKTLRESAAQTIALEKGDKPRDKRRDRGQGKEAMVVQPTAAPAEAAPAAVVLSDSTPPPAATPAAPAAPAAPTEGAPEPAGPTA